METKKAINLIVAVLFLTLIANVLNLAGLPFATKESTLNNSFHRKIHNILCLFLSF